MELKAAEQMARQLMAHHGLKGWVFKFDRARRRFGSCRADRKTISISTVLTLLNGESEIRNTLLHEIAHALAPKYAGHGPAWKKIAVALGCDGRGCYSPSVSQPKGAHVYACTSCKTEWNTFRKLKDLPQRRHSPCRNKAGFGRILKLPA